MYSNFLWTEVLVADAPPISTTLPRMWNVKFRPVLIFLVQFWHPYHPWLYIICQLTSSWRKPPMYPLNSAVLCLQPSQVPAWLSCQWIDCLHMEWWQAALSSYALDLMSLKEVLTTFPFTSCNATCLCAVGSTYSCYFSTPFCLRFYFIWHLCVVNRCKWK